MLTNHELQSCIVMLGNIAKYRDSDDDDDDEGICCNSHHRHHHATSSNLLFILPMKY